MIKSRIAFPLALILLLVSCGGGGDSADEPAPVSKTPEPKPDTFATEMREGVPHIHNTGALWGDYPDIRLEPVRTIGGPDSRDSGTAFYKPADIALDGEGNLYVLDAGNHRILKMDPDGGLIASFGRKGQGPGELQFPDGLAVGPGGKIYVSDKGSNNVKILDPLGHEAVALPAGGAAGRLILLSTGDLVCPWRSGDSPAPAIRFDRSGKPVSTYGEFESQADWDRFRFFNRVFLAGDGSDNVYVAWGTRNRIEKYSIGGELILSMDRPINFPESTEIKKEPHKFGARTIPIPMVNHVTADITVDSSNRIWVLSYDRQLKFEEMGLTMHFKDGEGRYEGEETLKASEEEELDAFAFHLFDPEGRFLGALPIPHHAGVVKIFQDRLYILEARHRMVVYRYRILETG